jgi:Fe-coproporphyrin III synthase
MEIASKMIPQEAIIAVNYHCNARCLMCDIWKLQDDGSMKPSDYERLPSSLVNVGITGGEPFIRRDLEEIVRVVARAAPKARMVINTNGYLTERIVGLVERMRDVHNRIGIRISLDGLGAMHDEMRGTRHAFTKVLRTVRALKEAGVKDLGFSFTATETNIDHLARVYELSRQLDVEFAGNIAQNSDLYFHKSSNPPIDPDRLAAAYNHINARELSTLSPKAWFRAYFNAGVVSYNKSRTRAVSCSAADDFFFLDPHGDLYPCLTVPKKLGNLKQQTFDQLWTSHEAEQIRGEISGCEGCWMMCTARTQLKRNVVKAAAWVVKKKVLGMFEVQPNGEDVLTRLPKITEERIPIEPVP